MASTLQETREEFLVLMDLYVRMAESLNGKRVDSDEAWRTNMQPLAAKLFFHLGTLFYVHQGTSLPPLAATRVGYIDFASLAVLTRAAWETYLTFSWIFVQPPDAALKRFRHRIWELGGLRSREGFPAQLESSKAQLARELAEIADLRERLQADPLFGPLEPARKKEALRGEWRMGQDWVMLAGSAGISRGYFRWVYRYLCGYAHTNYLSVLQQAQAETKSDQEELAGPYLSTGLMIMSHFITAYAQLSAEALAVLDSRPEAKRLVQICRLDASEMDRIYGAS